MPKVFYRWTRDLHLYVGLFASPFVLVYAVSAILLNHAYPSPPASAQLVPRTVAIHVTDGDDGLSVARQVREQVGVRGEIGYVNRKPQGHTLSFPIETPGRRTSVKVDLAAGTATLREQATGLADATIYLHKMPGPHNVKIRGNWIFTRLWSWLADGTVYAILFLSASGVYMWVVIRAARRYGLLFLGGGTLSFAAMVFAIVA